MLTFLLRRLLGTLPQLVAVSFLTFLLINLAPGGACNFLLDNPKVTQGMIAECRSYYGFDQPFVVRYARWLGRAVTGDFGRSYNYQRPVFALIFERVGNTLTLALTALVLAWGLALPLGVTSARHPYSIRDKLCGLLAYTGLSIPAVFFALLALLFALKTGWFPIGDAVSAGHDQMSFAARVADRARHLVLPAFVLAFTSMAGYMRQMRSSMLETLHQDFVRTARAKGLSDFAVTYKHAFINAINPLITLFGYSLAFLLNGSFLVEYVMNWPGMARLTITAIQTQDEPLTMAAVVMATTLLIAGNLVADLMLAVANPRIRLENR